MAAFDPKDTWGIVGGMLLLIFVYLILRDGGLSATQIIKTGGDSVGNLITKLQGRG